MLGLWELVQKRESKKAEDVPIERDGEGPKGEVPVVVVDPRSRSKFLEFPEGSHSEFLFFNCFIPSIDETQFCVSCLNAAC